MAVSEKMKIQLFLLDNNTCLTCRSSLKKPNGKPVLEAAHVWPSRKKGPDELNNLISLCPTCHYMLDEYCYTFTPENKEIKYHDSLQEILSERFCDYEPSSIERIALGYLKWHHERFENPDLR